MITYAREVNDHIGREQGGYCSPREGGRRLMIP